MVRLPTLLKPKVQTLWKPRHPSGQNEPQLLCQMTMQGHACNTFALLLHHIWVYWPNSWVKLLSLGTSKISYKGILFWQLHLIRSSALLFRIKFASLEAMLVWNYDRPNWCHTLVRWRATSIAKNEIQPQWVSHFCRGGTIRIWRCQHQWPQQGRVHHPKAIGWQKSIWGCRSEIR